jgi:hypothetical protein
VLILFASGCTAVSQCLMKIPKNSICQLKTSGRMSNCSRGSFRSFCFQRFVLLKSDFSCAGYLPTEYGCMRTRSSCHAHAASRKNRHQYRPRSNTWLVSAYFARSFKAMLVPVGGENSLKDSEPPGFRHFLPLLIPFTTPEK